MVGQRLYKNIIQEKYMVSRRRRKDLGQSRDANCLSFLSLFRFCGPQDKNYLVEKDVKLVG